MAPAATIACLKRERRHDTFKPCRRIRLDGYRRRPNCVESSPFRRVDMADIMLLARPFANVEGSVEKNLDDFVDKVVAEFERSIECNAEHAHLISAPDVWNDNEEAVVHVELEVFLEKMATIVGDNDVVVSQSEWNDVPILPTPFADVRPVGGCYTSIFGDRDQGPAEAFINEKLVGQRTFRLLAFLQSGPIVASAHRTTASMPSIGRVG